MSSGVLTLILLVVVSTVWSEEKRILLNENTDVVQDFSTLQTEVQNLQTVTASLKHKVTSLQQENVNLNSTVAQLQQTNVDLLTNLTLLQGKVSNGESVYTRWGRTTCSGPATQLVYKGYTGGSLYTDTGAAANYVCLTEDPQWNYYEESTKSGASMYGAEYETNSLHSHGGTHYFGKALYNEDVPCAVCHAPRAVTIMIPGRHDCIPGWSKEYSGYLMAGYVGHAAASEYVCVDSSPEVIVGGHRDSNGKLFHLVDAQCGSLKCPPYIQGRELTCVVCSK